MKQQLVATTVLAVTATLGALACGSTPSSDEAPRELSAACPEPADRAPPTARSVSFAADVLPVFLSSCAFAACHGSARGGSNGVFLGAKGGSNDAPAIRASLLGRAATQAPLPYVTPSDPSRSYLFRKLTDLCGLPCEDGRCGQRMPRGGDALDPASLETVRAWIAQGAPE